MATHKLIADIVSQTWDAPHDLQSMLSRNEPLRAFCDEVKKKLRGCEFAPKDSRSVWVYVPDQVYALGWVGYGDYRDNPQDTVKSYTVYSRHIVNDMYSSASYQYHTRGSVHMNVALRHASRYLTRYSPIEVARELRSPFKKGASDAEQGAKHDMLQQEKALFGKSFNTRLCRVAAELKVLLSTGYEFTDPAIGAELREYFTKEEEHNELAQERNAYCVVIDTFLGNQRYQVVSIDGAGGWSPTIHDDVSVYDDESIPGDLAGKLSVLSMCEVDQYVTDVGVRADDRVFYVAR